MSLSKVREEKGLNACQMAGRLGITIEELLAIEAGEKVPRLCLAQKWANFLDLSFEEFACCFYGTSFE